MLKRGRYVSVALDDVPPAPVKAEEGWRGMDMRFLIGSRLGVENVCVFRAVFAPGAAHEKHLHPDADEFSFVVRGRALLGIDDEEQVVTAGNARFIPAGRVHWLRQLDGEEVEVVGAYLGVGSLEEAGYEFVGHVE